MALFTYCQIQQSNDIVHRITRPNNEVRIVHEKSENIMNESGKMISSFGMVHDITEAKENEEEMEKLILSLQKTLAEIKVLKGILPICSFCKKIRNDQGYWEQVDVYIYKHSEADISHSICLDCMKKHHPEEYKALYSRKKETPL